MFSKSKRTTFLAGTRSQPLDTRGKCSALAAASPASRLSLQALELRAPCATTHPSRCMPELCQLRVTFV